MNILFGFYFYALGLFSIQEPNIYSLFYHWNKISLNALSTAMKSANSEEEKKMYQNTLEAMSEIWEIKAGSINNTSLRWEFLEQVSKEFDWKDKDWSVIEVKKNGERISLINYLICYYKKQTKIIVYDYNKGKWVKIREKTDEFKMNELIQEHVKVPINNGRNFSDVIVTDFKSSLPIQSLYFVESTLSEKSKVFLIISH